MNRLNPLHAGVVLIVLVLFFALKLSGAKEELTLVKEEYKETSITLNELSSLSSAYLGKEEVKNLCREFWHSLHSEVRTSSKSSKATVLL